MIERECSVSDNYNNPGDVWTDTIDEAIYNYCGDRRLACLWVRHIVILDNSKNYCVATYIEPYCVGAIFISIKVCVVNKIKRLFRY